jgi:hypothetical protein
MMISDQGWELRLPDGRWYLVVMRGRMQPTTTGCGWEVAPPDAMDSWPEGWRETAERLPWPADAPSGDEVYAMFDAEAGIGGNTRR